MREEDQDQELRNRVLHRAVQRLAEDTKIDEDALMKWLQGDADLSYDAHALLRRETRNVTGMVCSVVREDPFKTHVREALADLSRGLSAGLPSSCNVVCGVQFEEGVGYVPVNSCGVPIGGVMPTEEDLNDFMETVA